MPSAGDEGASALAPGTVEVLQAATRVLAGVALRSMDVFGSAVTLPQFRLLAVLAEVGSAPSGRAARMFGLDPSIVTRLADRMVAAGHVAGGADPRHRGVVTLELTASGRGVVAAADECGAVNWPGSWHCSPRQQGAVTNALGLLVGAAGDDYGITASRPAPL
jgi:DNA-binding MarR family transcriptional regulator